ncbi:hypothetical protein QIT50_gp01 [Pyrobaculum spherical virus 2]|uniref:Uncharacterized protein n=1 Tax=Pyrobaculum spherical virus 2 TaxID=2730632 RepID=A0A6M3VZW4_9VIRU|nr:hypothetical protein QIT50_gp01 [Pyrobaculum spherical virus 2]QJF12413.1 hypothetical protein PSV2_gp01 [Pyrobaculum spherical virus 2]
MKSALIPLYKGLAISTIPFKFSKMRFISVHFFPTNVKFFPDNVHFFPNNVKFFPQLSFRFSRRGVFIPTKI